MNGYTIRHGTPFPLGSGCLNGVDIGEHVYAMPLVEDLQVSGGGGGGGGVCNCRLLAFLVTWRTSLLACVYV